MTGGENADKILTTKQTKYTKRGWLIGTTRSTLERRHPPLSQAPIVKGGHSQVATAVLSFG